MQTPMAHAESSAELAPAPTRWASRYRGVGLLVAIALLAAGLQAVYWTGVVGSDDLGYLDVAEQARSGHLDFPPYAHLRARPVIWKPLQWVVTLLPGNAVTLALPSLLSVWIVFLTVVHLDRRWGGGAGWPAMALLAIVPVQVVIASTMLPDAIGSALGWLGVAIAARPLLSRDCSGALWQCTLGGFVIAAGYNAKEPVIFFIPGMLLFVLIAHTRDRWAWARGVSLGLGAAVWMAAEMAWLWRVSGDPLFHVHAMSLSQQTFVAPPVGRTFGGLLRYWTEYVCWLARPGSDFGPVGPILLIGAVAAAAMRTTWAKFLLCTIAPAAIYLSVGSTSFSSYTPIVHQSRYLVPVLPGLALLTASAIGHNWVEHPRLRPLMYIVGLLLLVTSSAAPDRLAGKWYYAETFSAGEQVLRQYPSARGDVTRLSASDLTRSRFAALTRCFELPAIEVIDEPPGTREEWVRRYGGSDVLVSRFDRVPPPSHHLDRSLHGPALSALKEFSRVLWSAPPESRLAAIWARCTGGVTPKNVDCTVEVYRIPAQTE